MQFSNKTSIATRPVRFDSMTRNFFEMILLRAKRGRIGSWEVSCPAAVVACGVSTVAMKGTSLPLLNLVAWMSEAKSGDISPHFAALMRATTRSESDPTSTGADTTR